MKQKKKNKYQNRTGKIRMSDMFVWLILVSELIFSFLLKTVKNYPTN